MDEAISTFITFTGVDDENIAKRYLDATNNDVEYAVTLYMESQHPNESSNRGETDEELAKRFQEESYGEDNVREADANVHRHETLVDSFMQPHLSRPTDIFGGGRVSAFNQRFENYDGENIPYLNDLSENSEHNLEGYEATDDMEDGVVVIDSDSDEDDGLGRGVPTSRRRANRMLRMQELTSTQQRLANLFRPPFDIMARVDLDEARSRGRSEKKWILINIQDPAEFSCQVLNRDFWSQNPVKNIIKESFIFLQYQSDSPNGLNYVSFYSTEGFPHIAILDPLTGERVYKWPDGKVPNTEEWINDVEDFLSKFSLAPGSKNPVVEHEQKFDPEMLTEEQQIEYAMKQSILEPAHSNEIGNGTSAERAINVPEDAELKPEVSDLDPKDRFISILAQNHEEPTSGNLTRVQVRFPNGKRLIRKLRMDDKVLLLFEWLKYIINEVPDDLYGIGKDESFTLSNMSGKSKQSLIDSLDHTIEDAGLKNASILLEKS